MKIAGKMCALLATAAMVVAPVAAFAKTPGSVRDLVGATEGRLAEAPPLLAVDRAKLPALALPCVPDVDAPLLQLARVRRAAQGTSN
jgi:hypothetical protein